MCWVPIYGFSLLGSITWHDFVYDFTIINEYNVWYFRSVIRRARRYRHWCTDSSRLVIIYDRVPLPPPGYHRFWQNNGWHSENVCSQIRNMRMEWRHLMTSLLIVVVILFPREYRQWRTKYMSNVITTRKPSALMILLVVSREARGSSGWQPLNRGSREGTMMGIVIASWVPSQYKDRLSKIWAFPCWR